jgi:hypothetical protein
MTKHVRLALGVALLALAMAPTPSARVNRDAPVSLVLMLDLSASVDFRLLELPRDVSGDIDGDLLSRLTPADRFGIGVFGATAKFSGFLQGDRRARAAAVRAALEDRSVGLNGPSRLWDAIHEMVTVLQAEPAPRGIFVITDGYASGNRLGLQDVIDHARAAEVRLSVIANRIHEDKTGPGPLGSQRGLLERLTLETGGSLAVDDLGDAFRRRRPGRFFERLLARLRHDGTIGTN